MDKIVIDGEPKIVTEIRHKILDTFKDLIFFEEGHKYYLNGVDIPSVSAIAHKFQPHFDDIAAAERYAAKHGETKEYWLDKWKFNNLKATTTGTLVHAFGESLGWMRGGHPELITEECKCKYNAEKDWLIPTRPKEEAIIKFMDDLPSSYHLVLNEARVFSGLNKDKEKNPSTQYCGTFDMLYYYDGDGDPSKAGLVIFDYKTNKELYKEFNRTNNRTMYPPFEDLFDEPYSAYVLQLNLYQIPLEDIGLKVLARRIIWLKDDGEYEKIPLPNVTEKLRKVV